MADAVPRAAAGAAGAFPRAVLGEALRQDRELIAGIAAYRRHPWRRDLADPPVLWSEGGSRLLDFGGSGTTLMLVPSLVNRASVLDLAPGRSMARFLAAEGLRVLLLDWGWPGEAERRFTLTDYIAGRLERAWLAAGRQGGAGAATAWAACWQWPRPSAGRTWWRRWRCWRRRGISTPATPSAPAAGRLAPLLEPAMAFAGTLPVDLLQMLFAMLDPFGVAAKYRAFARLDPAASARRCSWRWRTG